MKVTNTLAEFMIWESDDYLEIDDTIIEHTRWSILHKVIIKRLEDNTYWTTNYSIGATEYQDERPFQYDKEVTFTQVYPKEKVVTVYESTP